MAEPLIRILKVAIAAVFFMCDSLRCIVRRLVGRPVPPPFVVLMYHSVKRHEHGRFKRQMDQLLKAGRPVYADFNAAGSGHRPAIAVTFDDAYVSVMENALPVCRSYGIPASIFVPTRYLGSAPGWIANDRHRDAHERVLTERELQQLKAEGVLIGSHAATHRHLTQLHDEEISAELEQSRSTLQELLAERIDLFALPYGAYNDHVLRLASSAGYTRVFLNVPVRPADPMSHFLVGRIDVSPTDWGFEYALKIRGAFRWLPWAMTTKRRLMSVAQAFAPTAARRTA
jgi:peptidoglycan/xylan/chitin deacetylase (PgdA/CDA1 family)